MANALPPAEPAVTHGLSAQDLRQLAADPAKLIALADQLEREQHGCTETSAFWCPVHGDCLCPAPEDSLDDPDCPLHNHNSSHGKEPRLAVS